MRPWWKEALDALARGRRFVTRDVWRIGMPGEQIPHGFIIKNVRVAILLVRGVTEETLLLRAAALTFATILFLVPFLAFLFAFIQTFNLGDQVYKQMSDALDSRMAQLVAIVRQEQPATAESEAEAGAPAPTPTPAPAAQHPAENNAKLWGDIIETMFPGWHALHASAGDEAADPIHILVQVAEHGATNPKALSIAGVLYLLITVLGMMRNVELAFNGIWGVTRQRGVLRTISDYLMITLMLPFVMALLLGITAALAVKSDTPAAWAFAARGAQLAVICLMFSLIYLVVPNTRVQYRNALLGGVVAGVLWTGLSYAYVSYQIGLARYALFFSTFALFPLLLMWMYLSWLVLLFGSLISFAYQNEKTFAMERLAERATFAYREALAVRLFLEMAARFKRGAPPLAVAEAAEAWNVPTRLVNETLDELSNAGLVTACATEPVTYQPGRAPETIKVLDILQAMRGHGEDPSLLREEPAYQELYTGLDQARQEIVQAPISELAERFGVLPAPGKITPFVAARETR